MVRQLWPYLDGALTDEWQARISGHLEGCVNCHSHYDFARAFLEAVHDAGVTEDVFGPLRATVLAAHAAEGMAPG